MHAFVTAVAWEPCEQAFSQKSAVGFPATWGRPQGNVPNFPWVRQELLFFSTHGKFCKLRKQRAGEQNYFVKPEEDTYRINCPSFDRGG